MYDLILCGYLWIVFIDHIMSSSLSPEKLLTVFSNLFSVNDLKKLMKLLYQ